MTITIEPAGENEFGPCECCGNMSQRIWGEAKRGNEHYAAYFVHWTRGHVNEDGANFEFLISQPDGNGKKERLAVSLLFRNDAEVPGFFMVVDANDSPFSDGSFTPQMLKRTDVIGQPLAADVFALCDAIWLQDERLAELSSFDDEGPTTNRPPEAGDA